MGLFAPSARTAQGKSPGIQPVIAAFAEGVTVRAAGDVNVLDSFPQGRSGGGRGRAVITASNAMEYAFEGDQLADQPAPASVGIYQRPGRGPGHRRRGPDDDGLVSLNELYDYVFDNFREQNPHQTPSRQVEMEGELYLARSRRRRNRPAPIPPDLQAAITDQNMYTRRGAVHELESRLASEDLPVAAGAYEALAELARTDIRYVADLAAAAQTEPPSGRRKRNWTSGNNDGDRCLRTALSGCSALPSPAPARLVLPTTGFT